jgi:pimeloyl-ACP methyl ester carboxylesterase
MAVRTVRYGKNDFTISYTLLNRDCGNTILFLHGWGSNKELMRQAFGKYLDSFRHVYLDMPGFGKSPNDIFLKSVDYAEIIRIFLDETDMNPSVIVGHSFGGKVATLLNPQCLVLLSSSGIDVPKPFSVKTKIALFKILRHLGAGKLRNFFASDDVKGMNRGMYETFKYVVNESFDGNFASVKGKALLFWGKSDSATPLWTGEKIASMISGSSFTPMEGDHYFFLDERNARDIAKAVEINCIN